MDILLILAIFAALCLLQALLIALLAPRGFGYARRFSVSDASCGDKVEFIEVIRNRAPLLLPWVRMEARVPASFEFHTREEVEIRGENYHKSVFTLMPYSQITPTCYIITSACSNPAAAFRWGVEQYDREINFKKVFGNNNALFVDTVDDVVENILLQFAKRRCGRIEYQRIILFAFQCGDVGNCKQYRHIHRGFLRTAGIENLCAVGTVKIDSRRAVGTFDDAYLTSEIVLIEPCEIIIGLVFKKFQKLRNVALLGF